MGSDDPLHRPFAQLDKLIDRSRVPARRATEPESAGAQRARALPARQRSSSRRGSEAHPPPAVQPSSPARGEHRSGGAPRSIPEDAFVSAEDAALFQREVGAVRRLAPDRRRDRPRPRRQLRVRDEEAEVMAELADLVAGRSGFDTSWSDEHLEGLAHGIDRRLLKKLRKGAFSVAAHLDLHGRTRREAKQLVEHFLTECRRRGQRCVLIVHGRGLHSKERIPVIKEALGRWLTSGRIGRWVLAFCSARPVDGGLGAVYVLLRR